MPEPGNPQSLNRYSYVLNNPMRYTDPTGHRWVDDRDAACNSCGGSINVGYNFAASWTAWGGELANGGGGYPPIYRTGEPAANLEDAASDILGYCPITLCDGANGGRFVAKCSGGDCDFWLAAELACVKGCGDALKGALKFSDEALFGARHVPNRGFFGKPEKVTLEPGTVIDRYGPPGGSFASPADTPFSQRAMPPELNDPSIYHKYEVLKPLQTDYGKIRNVDSDTWTGGYQYDFGSETRISDLIEQGFLREVK